MRLTRHVWLVPLALAILSAPAGGQDLEAGKTPAQLFASNCAGCHQSPRGLARSVGPGLVGFLRQHYTTNAGYAATLAAYLAGVGSAESQESERRTHRDAASRGAPAERSEAERGSSRETVSRKRGEEERRSLRAARERAPDGKEVKRQRYLNPPGLSGRPGLGERRTPAIVSTDPEPVSISVGPVPVPPPHELPPSVRPAGPSPQLVATPPAPTAKPAEATPVGQSTLPVSETAAAARAAARAAAAAGTPVQPAAAAPPPPLAPVVGREAGAPTIPAEALPAAAETQVRQPVVRPDSAPEAARAESRRPIANPQRAAEPAEQIVSPAQAVPSPAGEVEPLDPSTSRAETRSAEPEPGDRARTAAPPERTTAQPQAEEDISARTDQPATMRGGAEGGVRASGNP